MSPRLNPRQLWALQLIAERPGGVVTPILAVRGVDRDTLSTLVNAGFVTETVERAQGGRREIELTRIKITEAGKQVIAGPDTSAADRAPRNSQS